MQGMIFTAFADMVIKQQGMQGWNQVLEQCQPASGGSYTSGQQYDDGELIGMVQHLSDTTGIPIDTLLQAFGEFLFPRLMENSPEEVKKAADLRRFLLLIDSVIHAEVKRVHPDAYLPTFTYDDSHPNQLIMYYTSRRQLCAVAGGLIRGAATYFNEPITLSQPQCTHHGAKHCQFVVEFGVKDESS